MKKWFILLGVILSGTLFLGTRVFAQAYTTDEIAKHDQAGDCWVILSGKVYDLTSYIKKHPGGSSKITSNCGQDATVAFQSKGGGRGHSSLALSLLPGYFVGDVSTKAPLAISTPNTNSSSPAVTKPVSPDRTQAITLTTFGSGISVAKAVGGINVQSDDRGDEDEEDDEDDEDELDDEHEDDEDEHEDDDD
jgi:predicted heme/steroid binding protein